MANERSLGSGRVEFDGAIDMHVHFGPEPLISRASGSPHAVDPRQAAQEAAAAGMKAIVLKAHEFPSHLVAQLVSADAPDVHVVGSICCDFPVGGLNPVAVEAALAAGAGMVWLPTISSAHYADHFAVFGWEGEPGISLLDEDGNLLPVVREILDLVHQYGAILATGHISRAEHFKVIEAYRGRGPIVVTHAMQERPDGPTLSEQDCLELASMGASIELTAHSCVGIPATLDRVAGPSNSFRRTAWCSRVTMAGARIIRTQRPAFAVISTCSTSWALRRSFCAPCRARTLAAYWLSTADRRLAAQIIAA